MASEDRPLRAKTLTGRKTPPPPAPRRWDGWARALAGRFRAGRSRRPGADLVLHRLEGGRSAGIVERIVERTLVMRTALFAPRLHLRLHLTVAPLVRLGHLGGTAGARSLPASMALPGGAAASQAGGAARPEDRRGGSLSLARHAAPGMAPLARALARTGPKALPAGPALTLASAGRHHPRVSASDPLVLASRVAARGLRRETPLPRPAATFHRPPPPLPPAETAEVLTASRRPSPGSLAAGMALPAGAPGPLAGTPGELERLTEQVIRRIDRRMDVWRERTGRVR
jgi:hypothetical protein